MLDFIFQVNEFTLVTCGEMKKHLDNIQYQIFEYILKSFKLNLQSFVQARGKVLARTLLHECVDGSVFVCI